MTVNANRSRIQRTDHLGSISIQLCVPNLCSVPPRSQILRGPLIRDLLMRAEIAEMILGTGVLNGTTDDTTALTDDLMSGRGLLTTDVTRLINVLGTTIASMITRVLATLRQLSTDKMTTVPPDTTVDGQQLLVLRIINNCPFRMVEMTDGCHRHPPLLL